MEYRNLGRTGINVSRLCFGSLTMGPAQADLSPEAGGELIAYAFAKGINFIDTAELYENYAHIRQAMRRGADKLVIATKTYAYSRSQAEESFNKARKELDVDVIDLFLLHEQETVMTMDGHREAFAYMLELKEKGQVRAIGLSTHAVEPVLALSQAADSAGDRPAWRDIDPGVYKYADVVHPLLNARGIGILDGDASAMAAASSRAAQAGLGIYAMKILGGGHLLNDFQKAFDFAMDLDCLASMAVGMQDKNEIDLNIALIEGLKPDEDRLNRVMARKRRLLISDWCTGCGNCVRRCGENALSLRGGKAFVNQDKCIFCGYCATVCRDFAIKVI